MASNGCLISLIVPTRGRPSKMLRFLESLKLHTTDLEAVEVVAVIDEDDQSSEDLTFPDLNLVTVKVPPGRSMGELNMAGYRASSGAYILLMNDDVVLRTAGWDTAVIETFKSFSDNIVLVHVNDSIFGQKLCTFPFVTRQFCEQAQGICPEEYWRYRIDDHIYNVFNLLALLGHKRIAYLPDVVFEHQNYIEGPEDNIEYVPDPVIHARDTAIFDAMHAKREDLAIGLAALIDRHRQGQIEAVRRNVLKSHPNANRLYLPELVRVIPEGQPARGSRVTIGVVTANSNSEHARTCLNRLRKYTTNFDLIILDNNSGPRFNHPHEMNRLLSACQNDFLVLMDDDVFVTADWLESMLSCMTPDTGVITPLHLDRDGRLSYAGIVMSPDFSGRHSHIYSTPRAPTVSQTLCSAVMLIDMTKVGHIRVDESYSKYFLDIDYGLRVWEAGYRVVVDPNSVCTHIGGATLSHGSEQANRLAELQRAHWVREWIDTKRFQALREGVWQDVPEFREILDLPDSVADLMKRRAGESADSFLRRAIPRLAVVHSVPALQHYVQSEVQRGLSAPLGVHETDYGHLMLLLGLSGVPVRIPSNSHDHDLYLWGDRFYAIPAGNPAPNAQELINADTSEVIWCGNIDSLNLHLGRSANVECGADGNLAGYQSTGALRSCSTSKVPHRVVRGFLRYNITLWDRYYGVPQHAGAFDIERVRANRYVDLVVADSLVEARAKIFAIWLRYLPRRSVKLFRMMAEHGKTRNNG